ncbi:MAG: response regulator [Gammaproteobacteria bacterium]|nr:response regulator [Gammaproteobacteria bacterium]
MTDTSISDSLDCPRHIILIIDDNPVHLKIMEEYLESHGLKIIVARSGESGLKRAVYALPDLILLDVVMPGIDGIETCRRLKANEATQKIPVIFMTALMETEDIVRGFREGAVDYITKPVRQEEVLARVLTHIRLLDLNNRLEQKVEERTHELMETNRKLQQEICERKQMEDDLRTAKELAEAANKAKSRFLANMSHELRTPMNAIIGMTQVVLETELTSEQRDLLCIADTSAGELLGILNNILDFSRLDAGTLSMKSVNFHLDEVLDNLSNLLAMQIEKKGLKLLLVSGEDVPRHLTGDPSRLGQILVNLTANAVKFTQKGEITVSTEVVELGAKQVTLSFSVHDTGIGILQEKIPRMFEAFTQVDETTTRKFGGTGLGLAICSRLVERMGGEIFVNSQPGKGSTFGFSARFSRWTDESDMNYEL